MRPSRLLRNFTRALATMRAVSALASIPLPLIEDMAFDGLGVPVLPADACHTGSVPFVKCYQRAHPSNATQLRLNPVRLFDGACARGQEAVAKWIFQDSIHTLPDAHKQEAIRAALFKACQTSGLSLVQWLASHVSAKPLQGEWSAVYWHASPAVLVWMLDWVRQRAQTLPFKVQALTYNIVLAFDRHFLLVHERVQRLWDTVPALRSDRVFVKFVENHFGIGIVGGVPQDPIYAFARICETGDISAARAFLRRHHISCIHLWGMILSVVRVCRTPRPMLDWLCKTFDADGATLAGSSVSVKAAHTDTLSAALTARNTDAIRWLFEHVHTRRQPDLFMVLVHRRRIRWIRWAVNTFGDALLDRVKWDAVAYTPHRRTLAWLVPRLGARWTAHHTHTACVVACQQGKVRLVQWLATCAPSEFAQKGAALWDSARRSGNVRLMQWFMRRKIVQPNQWTWAYGLIQAAQDGKFHLVRWMMVHAHKRHIDGSAALDTLRAHWVTHNVGLDTFWWACTRVHPGECPGHVLWRMECESIKRNGGIGRACAWVPYFFTQPCPCGKAFES
jgi:hypothetical protein